MKQKKWGRALALATVSSTLLIAGCGGGDDTTHIDLVTDRNQDNIPDELHAEVQKMLKIADAGTPGVLDPEEENAFFEAAVDIGKRLPLDRKTVETLGEIQALRAKMETAATEEQLTDYMAQLMSAEESLEQDPNYRRFDDALDNIPELNPSGEALKARQITKASGGTGFDQLQRGDIMLEHSGGAAYVYTYPYAWHFTHAGTYDGNNMVYESLSDGVQLSSIEHWKGKKRYAFGRNKLKTSSEVMASLDAAKLKYGTSKSTKYNWTFPNKTTDDKVYCSQLVWKIHKNLNTDIDSNSVKWFALIALKASPAYIWNPIAGAAVHAALVATVLRPAVAPDEIYYATNAIQFYYDK